MYERAYGSRYERDLDVKEIAKRLRAEWREAVAAGSVPAAKVSVRIERYSGGQSIDVRVVELPSGGSGETEESVAWRADNPHEPAPRWVERWTNEVRRVVEWWNSALWSYNYDGSDSMVDYFDVNFYGHVSGPDGGSFCGNVQSDETRAAEEAGAEAELESREAAREAVNAELVAADVAEHEAGQAERDRAEIAANREAADAVAIAKFAADRAEAFEAIQEAGIGTPLEDLLSGEPVEAEVVSLADWVELNGEALAIDDRDEISYEPSAEEELEARWVSLSSS